MKKSIVAWSAAAAASCLFASTASAHITLLEPTNRYGETQQKQGPCGSLDNEPNRDISSTFSPGETITVKVAETIYHPGYLRIAFDDDGDDAFVNPATGNDTYNNEAVLLDHVLIAPSPERPAGSTDTYEIAVELPNITCDNCTLQVIQVMTSDLDAPLDPNDIYYRCANLTLDANAPDGGVGPAEPDAGVDPVGPDAGGDPQNPGSPDSGVSGGCAAGGKTGAGGILLLGLALTVLRRRAGL